jgi:hypothetical protein
MLDAYRKKGSNCSRQLTPARDRNLAFLRRQNRILLAKAPVGEDAGSLENNCSESPCPMPGITTLPPPVDLGSKSCPAS